jgi:hypothetical protein
MPSAGAGASSSRGVVVDEPEGLRTPRAMQPVRHPSDMEDGGDLGLPDDDLTDLAAALSLTDTTTRVPSDPEDSPNDEHATQIDAEGGTSDASSLSVPRNIPRRFELTPEPMGTENVLTPRNDIGPFVLDGGAGRTSASGRRAQGGVASLDAAASEAGLGHV